MTLASQQDTIDTHKLSLKTKNTAMWMSSCVIVTLVLSGLNAIAVDGADESGTQPTFTITDDEYRTGSDIARLKVITNTRTGEYVSVIPGHGGCVDSLYLAKSPNASDKSHVLHKVLWDHGRNATAVRLNPTWKGRVLLPYANRIGNATYQFNGTTYHLPINDVSGLNNSLHGLLWNRSMQILSTDIDDISASITLGYSFDGSDTGYPFLLDITVTYTLNKIGFTITVAATNRDINGGWPLPFFSGWHPYILASLHTSTLTLDPCTAWTHVDVGVGPQYPPPRYSNMVPTGHTHVWSRFNGSRPFGGSATMPTYFDDEVKALNTAKCGDTFEHVLQDFDNSVQIGLSVDSSYKFLQIFTGAQQTWGVDAVVLEPLNAMSDAYNNHDNLHTISVGETYTSSFGIRMLGS
eukprot:m.137977 g.137977  ORF g.137977 m.137977 type:complete len:408 (+) comp17590_c0_seq2:62-1285(+)